MTAKKSFYSCHDRECHKCQYNGKGLDVCLECLGPSDTSNRGISFVHIQAAQDSGYEITSDDLPEKEGRLKPLKPSQDYINSLFPTARSDEYEDALRLLRDIAMMDGRRFVAFYVAMLDGTREDLERLIGPISGDCPDVSETVAAARSLATNNRYIFKVVAWLKRQEPRRAVSFWGLLGGRCGSTAAKMAGFSKQALHKHCEKVEKLGIFDALNVLYHATIDEKHGGVFHKLGIRDIGDHSRILAY